MFPRAFLVVLALALMMTVTLVSPAGATIKVYDVSFHTVYPSFNDVDGEFVAQFDPSQSIHSFATIKSLSGLTPPSATGIFDYAEEPIPGSPTNATRFVLTLTVQFGTNSGFNGFFTMRSFGYNTFPLHQLSRCHRHVDLLSRRPHPKRTTDTSCITTLVSVREPGQPAPPGAAAPRRICPFRHRPPGPGGRAP